MERLIGKKVCHKDLGEGTIIKAEDTDKGIIITVEYPGSDEKKRYGFPTVVGKSIANDDELIAIADDIARTKEEAKRKAEEERQTEEEKKERRLSDEAVAIAKDIIANTNREEVFSEDNFQIFKVHQGKTFVEEYNGGYLWAPASGNHHHERMKNIKAGDIIFHYANGALVAIGEALSDCFSYPRPAALAGYGYGPLGYRVEVRYEMFESPYSLLPHYTNIIAKRAGLYSSFDSNGDACQGYLYELECDLAKLFKKGILKTSPPTGVVTVLNRIK